MKIAFWKKGSGNQLSHVKGLTKGEVEFLRNLKEGDRLILWENKPESDAHPNTTLKVYVPKSDGEGRSGTSRAI